MERRGDVDHRYPARRPTLTDGIGLPFPHYEWPGVGQVVWAPDGRD